MNEESFMYGSMRVSYTPLREEDRDGGESVTDISIITSGGTDITLDLKSVPGLWSEIEDLCDLHMRKYE